MPEEERTITKRSKRKVHIKVINMKLIKVTIKLKKLIQTLQQHSGVAGSLILTSSITKEGGLFKPLRRAL